MSSSIKAGVPADMQFGIDRFLSEPHYFSQYAGKRLGLLAHPASVTENLTHTFDALIAKKFNITCAFGPQHGMRGEKQYNMIESDDYVDPVHRVPVFSLYGKSRKPTPAQLSHCDGVLVDLQDVGCRIYTYLTTLIYVMQECAKLKKFVVVLDRPNPAGRAVEGTILQSGHESFVGVGPVPMRHGLTLGEIAAWANQAWKIGVQLDVVKMQGYKPDLAPGFGWPVYDRAWVNPSPNIPCLSTVRCYPGTVLLEGTNLSEGRGTTRPLEGFGAPDLDGAKILATMHALTNQAKLNWLSGASLRAFYFEPTFYKHQGKLCSGVQFHADDSVYRPDGFKPYRIMALAFKAIRTLAPSYDLWRNFPYEYVFDRLAIDVIAGGDGLRLWVDDPSATLNDFEMALTADEKLWKEQIRDAKIY